LCLSSFRHLRTQRRRHSPLLRLTITVGKFLVYFNRCLGGVGSIAAPAERLRQPLEPHIHMRSGCHHGLHPSLPLISSRLYDLRGVHHVYLASNLYPRSTSSLALIPYHSVFATPYAEPIPTGLPLLLSHSPAWSLRYHACLPASQLNLHTYSGHVYSPAIHSTQAA
jgi:hypothetical protein